MSLVARVVIAGRAPTLNHILERCGVTVECYADCSGDCGARSANGHHDRPIILLQEIVRRCGELSLLARNCLTAAETRKDICVRSGVATSEGQKQVERRQNRQ